MKKITKSGIPLFWDNDIPYLDVSDNHTLLIGDTGSGKTQSIILPYVKTTILSDESMIINDKNGEIYKRLADKIKKEGYEVYVYNFENSILGNSFNPLEIAYRLYQDKKIDAAYKIIEILGENFFRDKEESDPYWTNTTIDFFKGLTLYLFENAEANEINLNSIYSLAMSLTSDEKTNKFLNKVKEYSTIYILLAGTINAPIETRNSIISVFNYKMKEYLTRDDLAKSLADTSFSLINLFAKKFVIFINNTDSSYSSNLTNILLEEIYYLKKITNNKDKLNIILDDFDELEPIKDFAKILNNSRYMGIRFLCTIKSYTNLNYNYGAYSEIIKMCFANIIYLRSNDLTTMEEISRLCGEYMKNEPLISVEELKRLKVFEAIVLLPRRLPYKAKLLPDYKINWGYETKESEYKERDLKDIKIYHQN